MAHTVDIPTIITINDETFNATIHIEYDLVLGKIAHERGTESVTVDVDVKQTFILFDDGEDVPSHLFKENPIIKFPKL
jgi:hypothetical protein